MFFECTIMTRSKLEFATILATLRGQGEDPQKLANEMTLRKLCYEIEKAEEAQEATPKLEPEPEPVKEERPAKVRPLWARLTLEDSDEDS